MVTTLRNSTSTRGQEQSSLLDIPATLLNKEEEKLDMVAPRHSQANNSPSRMDTSPMFIPTRCLRLVDSKIMRPKELSSATDPTVHTKDGESSMLIHSRSRTRD